MATKRVPKTFVHRLGRHHFAHLRAVAESVDPIESARLYLAIDHGHECVTAHRQVVDAVRAVARRHNESAWRLIGLSISVKVDAAKPSFEDFIAERDLDGWRESEVAEMYAEAYPADAKSDRRQKLRDKQLALLKRMEGLSAETPSPTDLVSGWFDDITAKKIITAGMLTLGDLNRRVSAGGRWFSSLPAIGEGKARRIAAHLATLLPRETQATMPFFALVATPSLFAPSSAAAPYPAPLQLNQSNGRMLEANNDQEAVDAWVAARAGSVPTKKAYEREANRLLLWLQYERHGKTLGTMQVNDCRDYMAFLQNIPNKWISRERMAPGKPGWAPFRGQLSHKSQGQAIVIVGALFTFLVAAQYLAGNPWVLVNTDTGDDRQDRMLDSKAFSEAAYAEVLDFVEGQPPSPSRFRIRFILRFVEAVGLRSAELISASLGDLRLEPEGWMMQVAGKGSKNRVVAVPPQAFAALQRYLEERGIGTLESAPAAAPLLASALDPMESIGYQALYETVRSWISRAVSASRLPSKDRLHLARASTHWLRHTFGTRAIARDVPLDVIQAQMGHASIQTTTSIYGRAPMQRRADELKKAFG
jgi:site-specific recombinase XerD